MLVTAAVLLAAQLVQGASPHGALQAQSAGDALTEMRSSQTKALKAVLENHIHQSLANAQTAAKKTSEMAEDAVLTRKLASYGTGYLIAKYHATSACDVSPEEYGIHLGTCYSYGSGVSVSYTCSVDDSTGTVTLTEHDWTTSDDCTGAETTDSDTHTGCALLDDDDYYYYYDDDYYPFATVTCTTNEQPWKSNENSVSKITYEDPTECASGTSEAVEYESFDIGFCFDYGSDSLKYNSCKNYQYYYSSADCTGNSVSVSIDLLSCAEDDDDDDYDDDDQRVYTDYCNDDDGDDDSACFSGESSVVLESGETKPIAAISVGDRVLTINSNGDKVFADVVFVPHQQNTEIATFVSVKTSSGNAVRMTKEHLLPAGDCKTAASEMSFVRADEIHSGMCVNTIQGVEEVLFVSQTTGKGTYTIITSETSGKVVVDGVVASSFGVNHAAANAFYNIHRGAYALFNALGMSKSVLGANVVVQANALFGQAALVAGKAAGIV